MDATNSKTKARILVIAIFLIGFTAGALSMNLFTRTNSAAKPFQPVAPANFLLTKMTEKLDLDASQQSKIKTILNEQFSHFARIRESVDPEVESARTKCRDEIRAVLKEDQKAAFEGMCQDFDRKREEWKEKEKETK